MKKFLLLSFLLISFFSFVQISKAATYDLYVNKNSASLTEDGTEENPFKTIGSAITAAKANSWDQRSIYISDGTYEEELVLDAPMSLTGQSKIGTIINGHGKKRTIEIKETSTINNLTVSEGHTGVFVDAGAGANIESCRVLKTEKMGIEIEKSSTSDSEKVTVIRSEIADGDGKGFYINKRRILIEDNKVENNDEEGIDIRAGVKGNIKKNTIAKNGESGIELILGGSGLKIKSNKIKSNSASGISNQFYKDSKKIGSVKLEKNTIKKNDNYGIQCATPSGGDAPKKYWTESIDLAKNVFSGNGTSYAKRCGFPIALKK